MVGRVAGYCVCIVIYASYNLCALMPLIIGSFYACAGAACTAKQVYIKQFNIFHFVL